MKNTFSSMLIICLFILVINNLHAELAWKETHKLQLNESVYKIQCVDSINCIMLVAYSEAMCRLYESNDGGFTWKLFHDEVPDRYINPRFVLNMEWPAEEHLYITFRDSKIVKSTDRGRTFSDTFTLPNRRDLYPNSYTDRLLYLFMLDSLNGIAAADAFELYTTNDGWKNYTHHLDAPGVGMLDVWMFSPNDFAYLSGGYNLGFFVRTKDSGKTWIIDTTRVIGNYRKFFFLNAKTGFIVGHEDYGGPGDAKWDVIHKTTDGGKTWNLIYKEYNIAPFGLGNPQQIRAIAFHDSLNGIATGQFSKILRTTDGGESWFQEYLPGHKENDKKMQSNTAFETLYIGSTPVLGGSQHQSVWRLMDVSSVDENSKKEEIRVFPNPFREQVNFSFSPETSGERVSVIIYDITGKEVENQSFYFNPNMGILQFRPENISASPSVYYYRIEIGKKIYSGSLVRE